ncbi:DUF3040 domain-containing protein [Gleimia hominis]|uniref:DUF3040 domain-containing protein n=1 Tax=Gleimia hominis TaxID=595468 RepID=UPI002543D87C|nr:DUF3040 domain-containing protein [Gleimia hominis]WIK64966.1 DUF3040 domain-containing protein [Gleimia hominis]
MALSEQERAILEQMERELRRDDPRLASTMSRQRTNRTGRTYSPRRVGGGVALLLVGLALPIIGLTIGILWLTVLLGVAGFALMLTGILFITVPTKPTVPAPRTTSGGRAVPNVHSCRGKKIGGSGANAASDHSLGEPGNRPWSNW